MSQITYYYTIFIHTPLEYCACKQLNTTEEHIADRLKFALLIILKETIYVGNLSALIKIKSENNPSVRFIVLN